MIKNDLKTDTFSTTHMIHPTLMTMREKGRKMKRETVRNVSGKSENMRERIFHQCNVRKNNNTATRMLRSRKGSFLITQTPLDDAYNNGIRFILTQR